MRWWWIGSLVACGAGTTKPSDTGATGTTPTVPTSPTTTAEGYCGVRAVLNEACVACHSPAGGDQGSLDLSTDPAGVLVNQPSPEYGGETLVVPGDPDGSFLIAKLEDTQGASEGTAMPVGVALPQARIDLVRAWITAGASSACTGTTGTVATRFHEAGWADPAAHGHGAKYQDLDCRSCHGEDLDGGTSGVSCDGCHAAGWRTDCTYCHGGVETPDGAPPENIDDSADPADLVRFPAHTVHVTETIHPAWDCTTCHEKPADVLSSGHLFVGDGTPGVAEVAYLGGTYTSGTCANLYCHGDGQTSGTADASFVSACDACHPAWDSAGGDIFAMSGHHYLHIWDQGVDCSECHSATVDANHAIVDPALHVDGEPTVALPSGMTWNAGSRSCSGTCHGQIHFLNGW